MRTTLTLDPDVAQKARKYAGEHNAPFKEVINRALRIGLEVLEKNVLRRPFAPNRNPSGFAPASPSTTLPTSWTNSMRHVRDDFGGC